MNCPKCGAKLGRMKDYVVFVDKSNVYASIIPINEWDIHEDGSVELSNSFFACPICGAKFTIKKSKKLNVQNNKERSGDSK